MNEFDASKLAEARLRDFAASENPEDVCSIIVELATIPTEVMPIEKRSPRPPWKLQPVDTISQDSADRSECARLMDEYENQLQSLPLRTKPVRLNMAEAFVVSVTPAELRIISRWPMTGTIRLNRTHHTPRNGSR